jgi:CubicO group peptidase (beta-lactamase class C family)
MNSQFSALRCQPFMGTVLEAEGEHVPLNKGYGMASLERLIRNAPDVRFRIGSLTKQLTASLVLLFQQDGRLNIDDPV